jgi:FkbM family methyltransferase
MQLVDRLRRKIHDVVRYPALAFGRRDRRDLWILGLVRNRIRGADTLRKLLGRQHVIMPRLAATQGEKVRIQFSNPGQIDLFDELFIAGIYDLRAVDFEPALVADCGAYCGYFSALAAGVFPRSRIVCFEANPANLPMLDAQLQLLTVKVELRPEAVFVRDGTSAFKGGGIGGALVSPDDPDSLKRVACVDFPRWLGEIAPASLVWKLDVEGAELEILPAVLHCLPTRTVCFLETHHSDEVCGDLLGPYYDAGFTVKEIRRRPAESKAFSYIEWLLTRKD